MLDVVTEQYIFSFVRQNAFSSIVPDNCLSWQLRIIVMESHGANFLVWEVMIVDSVRWGNHRLISWMKLPHTLCIIYPNDEDYLPCVWRQLKPTHCCQQCVPLGCGRYVRGCIMSVFLYCHLYEWFASLVSIIKVIYFINKSLSYLSEHFCIFVFMVMTYVWFANFTDSVVWTPYVLYSLLSHWIVLLIHVLQYRVFRFDYVIYVCLF